MGYRYELEAAAHLVKRDGGTPLFLSRQIFDLVTKELLTDIDIVLNGIYYQVKWCRRAFAKRGTGGIVKSMNQWIERARHGNPGQPVAYVAPPDRFPPTAVRHLARLRLPEIIKAPLR